MRKSKGKSYWSRRRQILSRVASHMNAISVHNSNDTPSESAQSEAIVGDDSVVSPDDSCSARLDCSRMSVGDSLASCQ